jgi:hypothetical protein
MDEPVQKRTRVGREEWAKRVERWRDSGLTAAEFAAELGCSVRALIRVRKRCARTVLERRRAILR